MTTEAGKYVIEKAVWDEGMRGHFIRMFSLTGPQDVEIMVRKIEEEAVARLRAALHRIWRADRLVHSAYDGECEHGFGPPATLCTNHGCPDKELAEAWRAALATAKEAGNG